MPTIDADTTGFFGQIQLTSWLDARDATSALFLTSTTSVRESSVAMWNAKTSGRGGFIYRVYRAYAMFGTSGITSVTNATLKVKGLTKALVDEAFPGLVVKAYKKPAAKKTTTKIKETRPM